jgi:hypothetical protein
MDANILSKKKMVQAVNFYRSIDFFEDLENLTDEECVDILDKKTQNLYFNHIYDELYGFERKWDLNLIRLDTSRVLWVYGELTAEDVVVLIKELSKISKGNFIPQEISVVEDKNDFFNTKYMISFSIDGSRLVLNYEDKNQYDENVIKELNSLIGNSKGQFEIIKVDQDLCVLFLSAIEKKKIENDRSINFV